MVNSPQVQAGNINGTAAGASWPDPGRGDNQILPGYGASPPTAPTSGEDAKTPKRVPEHEPWQGHESLNPTEVTVDKTEAEKVEE